MSMTMDYRRFQIEMFTKRHPVIMAMFGIVIILLDIAMFAVPCYIVISHCLGFGFAAEIEPIQAIALAAISAFGLWGTAKLLANLMDAIIQGSC